MSAHCVVTCHSNTQRKKSVRVFKSQSSTLLIHIDWLDNRHIVPGNGQNCRREFHGSEESRMRVRSLSHTLVGGWEKILHSLNRNQKGSQSPGCKHLFAHVMGERERCKWRPSERPDFRRLHNKIEAQGTRTNWSNLFRLSNSILLSFIYPSIRLGVRVVIVHPVFWMLVLVRWLIKGLLALSAGGS